MQQTHPKNLILTAAILLGVGVLTLRADPSTDTREPKAKDTAEVAPTAAPGIFFDQSKTAGWSIKGEVLFIARDGIFVKCAGSSDTGSRKPTEGEVVFLKDPFPGQGTFKGLSTGSVATYIGYSLGRGQNDVGRGIPKEVRVFELR